MHLVVSKRQGFFISRIESISQKDILVKMYIHKHTPCYLNRSFFYPFLHALRTCHLDNFEFSLTIYNRVVRVTPSSTHRHSINTHTHTNTLIRISNRDSKRWLERWAMGTLKRYDNGYRNIRIAKL